MLCANNSMNINDNLGKAAQGNHSLHLILTVVKYY